MSLRSETEIRKHRNDVRKLVRENQSCGCEACRKVLRFLVPIKDELTWVLNEGDDEMDRIVEEMSADAAKLP